MFKPIKCMPVCMMLKLALHHLVLLRTREPLQQDEKLLLDPKCILFSHLLLLPSGCVHCMDLGDLIALDAPTDNQKAELIKLLFGSCSVQPEGR